MKRKDRGRSKSKKRKAQVRVALCSLCGSANGFLLMNKFCRCITSESDWIKRDINLNGKMETVATIDPTRVGHLRSVYASKVPSSEKIEPVKKNKELFSKENSVTIHGQKIFFHKDYTIQKRDRFINSNEWLAIRMKVIIRDKKCLACGSTDNLQCDHIRPMASHWHLRKDLDNLQLLCKQCNFGKGLQSIDFRGGDIKIID